MRESGANKNYKVKKEPMRVLRLHWRHAQGTQHNKRYTRDKFLHLKNNNFTSH